MERSLNEIERRILGALMEKKLAQPTYYPMTVNALTNACNQKSNRNPVMDLDEPTVFDALEILRDAGLVVRIAAGAGSRVDRYRHEAAQHFGWQSGHQAIMAELLLRGPQTVGELRTRCARMVKFDETTGDVSEVLDQLCAWDPPMACMMPRAAGQSAVRYRHMLYEENEQTSTEAIATPPTASVPAAVTPTTIEPATTTQASMPADDALRTEVDELQEEMGELHQELADLRRRLETLEDRIG